MPSTSSQRAKTGIAIALSLTSFAMGVWSRHLGPHESITFLPSEIEWIVFLLVALLIPLYTIQASVQLFLSSEVDALSNDLRKAIAEGKVVCLGNATEVAPIVVEHLLTAKEVWNTYIASEPTYPERVRKQVEDAIVRFVKRDDTRWEETCSQLGKARVDSLRKRLRTLPSSYRVRILKADIHDLPACNFVILKRSDADPIPEEIFFGWGYFRNNPNESVFWSNQRELIGFFRGYHKALRSDDVSFVYDHSAQR